MFICNSSQPCASECSQAGWLYTGSDNNKYGTVYGYILIYMGVYYSMLYHPKPKVLLSWCGHLPTSSECRILTLHQAAWGVRDGVENDVFGQGRGVSVCRRVEWDGWAWKAIHRLPRCVSHIRGMNQRSSIEWDKGENIPLFWDCQPTPELHRT